MARRSFSDRVCQMLYNDDRLGLLGPALSNVWFRVTQLINERSADGVVSLGSLPGFPMGFLSVLAYGLHMAETELQTQLQTLCNFGLLVPAAGDGVALPPELALTPRQRASRINGAQGGRPPKSRADPRQGSIPIVIGGGLSAETQGTQDVTQGASQSDTRLADTYAATTTTDSDSENESGGGGVVAARESGGGLPPWVPVAAELAGLAGHTAPVPPADVARVRGWLDAGAGRDQLRDVFRAVLARDNRPAAPALSYFDGPVRDALAARPAARPRAVEPAAPAPPLSDADFKVKARLDRLFAAWAESRQGPMPPLLAAFKAACDRGLAGPAHGWLDEMDAWLARRRAGDRPENFPAHLAGGPAAAAG